MSIIHIYKSRSVLKAIEKDLESFVYIQSWWRRMLEVKRKKHFLSAIVSIQRLFRSRDRGAMIRYLQRTRRKDLVDYLRVTSLLVGNSDKARTHITCPITQEVCSNPVLNLRDGHIYEKNALLNWINGNFTSPMTRAFTLPWNIVSFRQAHTLFEAMTDCIHGRDFYCPRCNRVEFRFGGEMGYCISSMWLRCQQHLMSECPTIV